MAKTCIRCDNRRSAWNAKDQFATSEIVQRAYGVNVTIEVTLEHDICYFCQSEEQALIERGFTKVIDCAGKKIGFTELAMHCKIAGRKAVMARVMPDHEHYAFVLDETGIWTQGNFRLHFDSVSIS